MVEVGMSTRQGETVTSDNVRDAVAKIEMAREQYRDALASRDAAQVGETESRNRLNQYEREFDELLNTFRRGGPNGTSWKRGELEGAAR